MSASRASGRVLWAVLALVLAATAWLGQTPDDELLAPPDTRTDRPGPAPSPALQADGVPPADAVASGPREALASPVWWQAQHTEWVRRVTGRAEHRPDMAHAAWGPWDPEVPPPVARLSEPSERQAPVFPHAWVGRVVDDMPRAVIAGPQRTWVLRAGEVLDGQWRLDALGERQLSFTYLPLQQTVLVSARSSATP